ncbi:DNA alkylation repair protein [Bowmanella dokdonensis]|uniref:DNA alkylation repair protein n=1 Tax=Bowmanella dokdonensis TaxID=751969 RepID=A0A939ISG7_9ALTE|nr:DNA alkylation repair protein [Bowmanella dokdonensis]MBN7827174.1 DNA alkylation repair protein [Bowmanella dokdonensis]
MNPQDYALIVEKALRPLADASRAESMKAYLRGKFDFLGLSSPVRREAVKPLAGHKWLSAGELLQAAQLLWNQPQREFCYTAVDMLRRQYKLLSLRDLAAIEALMLERPWWETVDGLAMVISKVLKRHAPTDSAAWMDAWVSHHSFWVRRAAMLHQLGWRGQTDFGLLCIYAEQLADEQEFFIRKAIGWALRDYAKWAPKVVQEYLQNNRVRFSGLTVREASKHLTNR